MNIARASGWKHLLPAMPDDWPPCPLSRRIRLHSWGKHVAIQWTDDTKKKRLSNFTHMWLENIPPTSPPNFHSHWPEKNIFQAAKCLHVFSLGFARHILVEKNGEKLPAPSTKSAWICHGGKNRRADEISGPSLVAARSASRDGNGFQRRSMSPLEDAGWFYWIRTEGTERIDKQWMIPANTCKESMTKTSSYTSYVPNRRSA